MKPDNIVILKVNLCLGYMYYFSSPPPPTPPTRTSSSLPRPDRPAEPPRVTPRHQRNASDGGIIDSLNLLAGKQQLTSFQPPTKSKKLDSCEEVSSVRPSPLSKQ